VSGPAATLVVLADVFSDALRWHTHHPPDSRIEATITARPAAQGWKVLVDDLPTCSVASVDELAGMLEWQVATAAAQRLISRYLLFHAGALASEGRGILLPAPSGSGKSTLVAAMVAAGCQYYSDDVAVLSPRDLHLYPFLRRPCIKSGSFSVLACAYPRLREEDEHVSRRDKLVRYLDLPPRSLPDGPVPVRCIVFPQYVVGASTELTPIRRTEALTRLIESLHNPLADRGHDFRLLVELVRGADCYTLTSGDLDQAVRTILAAARDGHAAHNAAWEGDQSA
jgi:hypothetical protein